MRAARANGSIGVRLEGRPATFAHAQHARVPRAARHTGAVKPVRLGSVLALQTRAADPGKPRHARHTE